MRTFEYFSKIFGCNVKVTYSNGIFHSATVENNTRPSAIPSREIGELKCNWPVYLEFFLASIKDNKNFVEIKRTITFDEFWDKYNYKMDKVESQRVWKNMTQKDQLQAFDYIAVYESQLKANPVAKQYGASYLRAKRWVK